MTIGGRQLLMTCRRLTQFSGDENNKIECCQCLGGCGTKRSSVMRKYIVSLVLVIVLVLSFGIASAADQPVSANPPANTVISNEVQVQLDNFCKKLNVVMKVVIKDVKIFLKNWEWEF
jgi:hypothetical protein